mgnify:CR=1 FL=1
MVAVNAVSPFRYPEFVDRAVPLLLAIFLACGDASHETKGGSEASTGSGGATGSTSSGDDAQRPSPCGEIPSPPEFAVGTGEVCYEPVRNGQVVPHITGPQGGYHVWVSVVCPACPREVVVTVGARHASSGELVAEASTRVIELKSGQAAGLIASLVGSTDDPSSHLPKGTMLRVFAELATLGGEPLHAGEKLVELGELEIWLNLCDPDPATCGQPGGKKCCD